MFKTTQSMFDYWSELRGAAACPRRSAVDPRAIGGLLSETFLLNVDPAWQLPYRLAGSRVCGLFGHELKDVAFASHFDGEQRETMLQLMRSVVRDQAAAMAYARGNLADGRTVRLEILLLPIAAADGTPRSILGAMTASPDAMVHEYNLVKSISIYAVQMLTVNGETVAPSPSLAPEMLDHAARTERPHSHLRLVVSR